VDVHLSLKFRSAQSGTRETRETRREIFFNFCTTRIALYAITPQQGSKKKEYFSREQKKKELFVKSSEFCLIRKTARARSCV